MYEWMNPGIAPAAYSWAALSSKRRMVNIFVYMPMRSFLVVGITLFSAFVFIVYRV
jgi:hypothetical protein